MPHFFSAARSHSTPKQGFVVHSDSGRQTPLTTPIYASHARSNSHLASSPSKTTLSSASSSTINSRSNNTFSNGSVSTVSESDNSAVAQPSIPSPSTPRRMASTIRTVSDFDDDISPSTTTITPSSRSKPPSASTNGYNGRLAALEQRATSIDSTGSRESTMNGRTRFSNSTSSFEAEIRTRPSHFARTPEMASRQDAAAAAAAAQRQDIVSRSDVPPRDSSLQEDSAWDSTVGKAGLGKTGRVINKLVSDNEALKRDLAIEKLKADEFKSSARLLEDKMERLSADVESRLVEANVTKTLLGRKERQLETLQAQLDLERKRAADAQAKEQTWREELDKTRNESKRQVDQANNNVLLAEGRYNAISSHWKDQGLDTKRAIGKMEHKIAVIKEEKHRDDEKINTLNVLCEQQDSNIRDLHELNLNIMRLHEAYKAEQERALERIKSSAARREAEQERMLEECRETLDKIRWVKNVKDTVAWAK